MSMSRKLKKKLAAAALALSVMSTGAAYAMPTGGEVQTGTVTGFSANPASGATIANTTNALINWNAFNIANGETLNFNTAAGTILMNQVTGNTATSLLGTLTDAGSGSLRVFAKMCHSERIGRDLYRNVPGDYEMGLFRSAVKFFK